jgi:choline-glycine betaine transporter
MCYALYKALKEEDLNQNTKQLEQTQRSETEESEA